VQQRKAMDGGNILPQRKTEIISSAHLALSIQRSTFSQEDADPLPWLRAEC